MKLFRGKFLILTLVCCVGIQPVALPKEDLSFGQEYFLKIAQDPVLSNITTLTMWAYQYLGKLAMFIVLVEFLRKNNQGVQKPQVENDTRQIAHNDTVDSKLVQDKDAQISI